MLCTQGAWPKKVDHYIWFVHVRIVQTNPDHSHQPDDYCMTLVHHYSLEKRERHKDLGPDDSSSLMGHSVASLRYDYETLEE